MTRAVLHKQPHLLEGLELCTPLERAQFARQIEMYEPLLEQQLRLLEAPRARPTSPVIYTPSASCAPFSDRGRRLVKEGKVGCVILSGGQGTRLGFHGPKGELPITAIQHKSLFQLAAEKVRAASAWAGRALPVCFMTSPLNHQETLSFFERHQRFGLGSSQLFFMQQEVLPLIDIKGHWVLEKPGKLCEGPDGNGHALRLLFSSGIAAEWRQRGIEYITVLFIDNPLANPFHFEWIGCAKEGGHDLVLSSVIRKSPREKMGLLIEEKGKLAVVEYSELSFDPPPEALSSTGILCASMDFIRYACQEIDVQLPLHAAYKQALVFQEGVHQRKEVMKCERFLFDWLAVSRSSTACVSPREEVYAPVKNAQGEESVETAQKALLQADIKRYEAVTGRFPQAHRFELDLAFHYPFDDVKEKLESRQLAEGAYIPY